MRLTLPKFVGRYRKSSRYLHGLFSRSWNGLNLVGSSTSPTVWDLVGSEDACLDVDARVCSPSVMSHDVINSRAGSPLPKASTRRLQYVLDSIEEMLAAESRRLVNSPSEVRTEFRTELILGHTNSQRWYLH